MMFKSHCLKNYSKKLVLGFFIISLFFLKYDNLTYALGIDTGKQHGPLTVEQEATTEAKALEVEQNRAKKYAEEHATTAEKASKQATHAKKQAEGSKTAYEDAVKASKDTDEIAKLKKDAELTEEIAVKSQENADAAASASIIATAASDAAQQATTAADAKKAADNIGPYSSKTSSLQIDRDHSTWLTTKELEKLINKSSSFNVSEALNVGNEGKLEISAEDDEKNLLHKALNLVIKVIGTLSILLYVIAGFFIITSNGDENQLQKGKTIITYTTLGLIVAFTSYLLVYLVMSATFNLN